MKMCEIKELKFDFANTRSGTYCQACLSTDRNLSSVGENVDIFRSISNISYNVLPQNILLCWECLAVLNKIKLFKAKIEDAQRILACHLVSKKKLLLKTLSKLTTTYSDHTITIIYKEQEEYKKEKLEIKEENHSDNDFNDYNQESDYHHQSIYVPTAETQAPSLREGPGSKHKEINSYEHKPHHHERKIKKESAIDTNLIKKNKTLPYRIVIDNSKKVLRKKVVIPFNETKVWLDRERNSDFFKKLKFKCKLCVKGFNSKEKLEGHILKYHDESIGDNTCKICFVRFKDEISLNSHVNAHKLAWECARCGFQCYTSRRLNAHIRTHSAVQCVYCDAQFQDLPTFYGHYKSLHSIFLCDNCGKRCKTKHMLEKHMSRHLDTHSCNICSRRYKSRAALRKHLSLKHSTGVPEAAYCVLCDKQYASELVYRRHVQTSAAHACERDTQYKKFQCPECNNIYSRRAYMMNHYRHVHTNQSKHYCSHCDRHFLNRTRYVEHMRYNHEGVKKEKNKLCNICGRGFAANRTLLNHLRTHSGERPFECEYCPAKFTQRTSMLSHVKYIHMKSKRRTQWQQ